MAHVIAVLNQKGGSGKTTIATNLAHALKLADAKVLGELKQTSPKFHRILRKPIAGKA